MSDNPLKSHSDRRKQRIDDLAATAGDTARTDTVTTAGTVEEAPGVSLIASAWRRPWTPRNSRSGTTATSTRGMPAPVKAAITT